MPILTDPANKSLRYRIVLDGDKGKKPEPCFYAKVLSGRQVSEFVAKIDAVNIVSHDYNDRMYELIGSCIVGWDNIIDPDTGEAIEYSPKALQSVLTVGERAELLSQLIYQGPTADELKNCDSPSRSSAAASAKAVRGRKPAKTRRRK